MKKWMAMAAVAASVLVLAGCQAADVVGKVSVTSFEALLEKSASTVAADEANNGWALTSAGGERFVWSRDFSAEGVPDLIMELDAAPFLEAGLDPARLDPAMYLFEPDSGLLRVHAELGADAFTYSGEATPMDSFKKLVETHRDSIGYHETLDHYGVAFGNGNMFEWAKDLSTNDKDLVFVLNPQPFIDAGVDPAAVKEWVFAPVEVKDDQGKPLVVDKFLKPYDLD